jgi:hypothetical protein
VIILCIGRKEQGKTTLGYYLARPMSTRLIYDPREHFFTSSSQLQDTMGLADALDNLPEIIIKPEDHIPEHFELTCDVLRQWLRENREEQFAFLVDESYDVKTPDYMPPSLDWLMRKTKRKQGRIIFTAHRPADISTDIRALSDSWMIFHTTQEHDLRVIAERCGGEVAEVVQTLKDREFVHWDDSVGRWTKISQADVWYVSLNSIGGTSRVGLPANL